MPNLSEIFYFTGEFNALLVVFPIIIGICIAVIIAFVIKISLGKFVRQILHDEVHEPCKAASLEDLGFSNKKLIRFAVKSPHLFKKYVHAVLDDDTEYRDGNYYKDDVLMEFPEGKKPKLNVDIVKFYIPVEKRYRASVMFGKRGSTLSVVFISIAAFIGIGIFALYIVPELITMWNNFLNNLQK